MVKTPEETLTFIKAMKTIYSNGFIREFSPSLWETFETAKKYYKEHLVLKQLSNSYNSM